MTHSWTTKSRAGRAPGRPKPARVPAGDRPMYSSDEGLQWTA
jgi:hypothetical protein